MTSPLYEHYLRWKDCKACPYGERRDKVVIGRGKVPAPVLFIGEAPGDVENIEGLPFVGPAGIHPSCGLNSMIRQALEDRNPPVGYAITNVLGCIPRDEDWDKEYTPNPDCIGVCSPRLIEFIRLCNPKLVVCVGDVAWEYTPHDLFDDGTRRAIKIAHPARILRSNVAQRGILVQGNVVAIEEAVDDLGL